jgi:predicted HicB family RNase H-like nuclease
MSKSDSMKLRVQPEEKEAFQQAADLAGVSVSSWIRERLRRASSKKQDNKFRL